MQLPVSRIFCVALCLLAAGCASPQRALPKFEKPLARAPVQAVRTTAYTHTEADHRKYSNRTAAGGRLQYGHVKSAACDWSRWPAGTLFRIRETGEVHEVDDYGWALAGTNTIDLYKPSRRSMNNWGVRRVNIEILRWGDVQRSLAILRPRSKHRHVRRMLDQINDRYAELSRPVQLAPESSLVMEPASAPEAPRATLVVASAQPQVSTSPAPAARNTSAGAPLKPFVNAPPR
ncbi:MAG: hypothetical protein JWQ44_1618 [Chthoniobacter sp.]|jgi:3D (Asp-Asp-Asp) domain-containing protein|nr:hypothetical protein [Chthoniobacter sp.]